MIPQGILMPLIPRLLSERTMHGYELMEQIYDRTQGLWRPTPASIYPTLSSLEEEGYIALAEEPDSRKGEKARRPYLVTEKGRAALSQYGRFRKEWDENLSLMRNLWW